MKHTFSFQPYSGPCPSLFLGCIRADEPSLIDFESELLSRRVLLSHYVIGDSEYGKPEAMAESICNCKITIFYLSKESIESMAFRNAVNYALSLKKNVICIKNSDFPLSYGLDMQLANIPILANKSASQMVDYLISNQLITQEMIHDGMILRDTTRKKKKKMMIAMVSTFILILLLSSFIVVQRRNSAAYLLKDVDGREYLDISSFDDSALSYLEGCSFEELNMAGGNFSNISDISKVSVKKIDISNNPNIVSLWPITQCKGIECVSISQDMLLYADDLIRADIRVIITK